MADTKKKRTRKPRQRIKGVPPAAPPPAPQRTPDAPASQILDLTGAAERRPTIKMDQGDFRMRLPEELTFAEFAEQAALGKRIVAVGDDVDDDVDNQGMLEELQALVVQGVRLIVVDMDDEAAQRVSPGQFALITVFFNKLGAAEGTTSSETGSSDAPDASASSEVSEAA